MKMTNRYSELSRKAIAGLVLGGMAIGTIGNTTDARAAAGIASLEVPALAFLGVALGGAVIVQSFVPYWDGLYSPRLFMMGIMLLDGEKGQTLAFQSMTDDQAQRLDLSKAEMTAYNDEIDEINSVREAVVADLSRIHDPTVSDSAQAWRKYGNALSTNAFSAVKKIATQGVRKN